MALSPTDVLPLHTYATDVPIYLNELVLWRPSQTLINTVGLFIVVSSIWVLAFFVGRRSNPARIRTRQMRWEREKEVRSMIGDAVTDAVEDLVHKSKLKRDEASFWYNRLGNVLTIPDILQKNNKAMKDRLMEKHGDKLRSKKTNVVPMRKKFLTRA